MQPTQNRLYDAFGELIYALAMSDGLIQPEETQVLETLLNGHPWAKEIQWSFDYESSKEITVEEAYDKALHTFKEHGPDPDYAFLRDVLEAVAKAGDGVVPEEKQVMDSFSTELIQRFIRDLENNKLHQFD